MQKNKREPHNPFLIAGYYSPEYFCDREAETAKIISALENDRNISYDKSSQIWKNGFNSSCFLSHCSKI